MERQPVKSSNIKSVGHDPNSNTLEVEFKDGSVYQYAGVDTDKHQALINAKSIGSHFHQYIKSSHKFTKS